MAAHGEIWKEDAILEPVINVECLETVRVLHKTIVSLREALEKSRSEVHLLQSKVDNQGTSSKYNELIEKLALENHILKRRILSSTKKLVRMEHPSNPLPGGETDEDTASKNETREQYDVGSYCPLILSK